MSDGKSQNLKKRRNRSSVNLEEKNGSGERHESSKRRCKGTAVVQKEGDVIATSLSAVHAGSTNNDDETNKKSKNDPNDNDVESIPLLLEQKILVLVQSRGPFKTC